MTRRRTGSCAGRIAARGCIPIPRRSSSQIADREPRSWRQRRHMRTTHIVPAFVVAALISGHAFQNAQTWPPPLQPMPETSPVLSRADSRKTMVLPPGYRLELVASEPMIQEPVLIEWDTSGRMWVVEMPGYMEDM